ncbi:hypothetical protein FOZ61_003924 [Perkinsus olseni]|uniref:Dipeptidase n=3 Tax=Perkinsus olseni TaxID=32597 RepID=A0A7J6LMY3_PEROL|nr:hypothetical protein FOZ61_003924 [Perkinsus olseni]
MMTFSGPLLSAAVALATVGVLTNASSDADPEAVKRAEYLDSNSDKCTSMIFGRKATTFGYPVATHANDCNNCDNRMAYVPRGNGTAPRPVFDNIQALYPRVVTNGRSDIYEPLPGQNESMALGYVPSEGPTHALWESSYPLINSKGLAIGESTTAAKKSLAIQELFHKDEVNGKEGPALFTIAPLMAIAMERCETARCAINKIGTLAQQYGFAGEEYGSSEAITIIDDTEAWVFEIQGDGNKGAFWVAQRVPDDHVAVVANNVIIKEVKPDSPDEFIYSENLFEKTKELGLWDGVGPFDWSRVVGAPLPLPRYASLRQWRVFDRVAHSQKVPNNEDPLDYPFSVPVDRPVTISEIFDLHRDHYEGTEYDMTKGILAGMYGNPNYEIGGDLMKKVKGQIPRAISLHRTSYTMVATSQKPFPKVWYALDAPATSVFVPFYSQANAVDPSFGTQYGPALQVFNRSTAFWAFDFVANWMNINYQNMSQEMVYPKRDELQRWVLAEAQRVEDEAAKLTDPEEQTRMLNSLQLRVQRRVTEEWWKLADELIVRYNDGYYNFPDGRMDFQGGLPQPDWYMRMIGFTDDFYRPADHYVRPAGKDAYEEAKAGALLSPLVASPSHSFWISLAVTLAACIVTFWLGTFFGKRHAYRSYSKINDGYSAL